MINRLFYNTLSRWKDSVERRPLMLRGARQVGKSFTVRTWGQEDFARIVELNFEARPELKSIFEDLDPISILHKIARVFNAHIEDGSTLVFFDEIQECPKAILALRYIFERRPNLHVIAAGSLLDFVLKEQPENLRIPVGRIEYRYLQPLSFVEFLKELGQSGSIASADEVSLANPISKIEHEKLLKDFAQYLMVGGMPAVMSAFAKAPTTNRYQELQSSILQTYREDFRKYRSRMDIDVIENTFRRLSKFVARRFKFSDLLPASASKSTRRVLDMFEMARVINKVFSSKANGVPLDAEIDDSNYKYILVDVGLLNSFLQIPYQNFLEWNSELINSGSLAEQVVGQELLAYAPSHCEPRLHYWERDKPGSSAEVDYVIVSNGTVFPVEVKAGTTGRLKSLRLFMEQKKSPLGIRISQHELSFHDKILSVPFYAISSLGRFVTEALNFPK